MEKKKILMIDDEKDVCEVTKLTLERSGRFEVAYATDAQQGIDLAKSYKPDLVLLDIVMPDLPGTDVAAYLADDPATKNIPVIFLTALVQNTEVEKQSGVIGQQFFISKSISTKELIAQIEDIFKKGR